MSSIVLKKLGTDVPGITEYFRYKLEEKLGVGGYGIVWKAIYVPPEYSSAHSKITPMYQELAIKVLNDYRVYVLLELNEKRFLQSLDPERFIYPIYNFSEDAKIIVDGYGYRVVEKIKVIITRYFPGEDLIDYVKRTGRIVNLNEQRWFIKTLCGLVNEIHEKGIIHGDIKPENFLYSGQNGLRVLDFDFSVLKKDVTSFARGSYNYIAPEALYNLCVKSASTGLKDSDQCIAPDEISLKTNEKIDVWPMLATLFAIFFEKMLFEENSLRDFINYHCIMIKRLIKHGGDVQRHHEQFFTELQNVTIATIENADNADENTNNDDEFISDGLKKFFLWALKVNQSERPTIEDILSAVDRYFPKKESACEIRSEEKALPA